MKTLKRIYVTVLAVLSVAVLFMPMFINTNSGGLAVCVCMGALGVFATLHFLKFNDLNS